MHEKNIDELRADFLQARKALAEAQKYPSPQLVQDYEFTDNQNQAVRLSTLFANKQELFMIHNMGTSCAYCTLWADGFNGAFHHLTDRAAVVISSPDPVEVQQAFKAERDWQFSMVSTANNSFAADMGYHNEQGYHPGVSVFTKSQNAINRVADTPFGPGDDFCAAWHLFDLLPNGADGWQPKFAY